VLQEREGGREEVFSSYSSVPPLINFKKDVTGSGAVFA
jgi:hypothetical protein